jgi:hypothetical protein
MKSFFVLILFLTSSCFSQTDKYFLLKADRVFDGENMQTGWSVLVKNNKIEEVGTIQNYPANT